MRTGYSDGFEDGEKHSIRDPNGEGFTIHLCSRLAEVVVGGLWVELFDVLQQIASDDGELRLDGARDDRVLMGELVGEDDFVLSDGGLR